MSSTQGAGCADTPVRTVSIRRLDLHVGEAVVPCGGPTIEVVDVLLDGRTPDELLARLLAETPRQERIGVSPEGLLAALRGERRGEDGRVAIRECPCTCEGCDPLRVRIRPGADVVVWDDLTEGCLDDPIPEVAFRFDRAEHDRAIAALVADLER